MTTDQGPREPPLHIRFDIGEDLVAPDSWPRDIPAPAPGELLTTYWNRAIFEDTFFQSLMIPAAKIGISIPSLERMCPADWTLEWCGKHNPEKVVASWVYPEQQHDTLGYHIRWIAQRLAVEIFDRLRAGDWVIHGCRADDPEQQSTPIPRVLWKRSDMMINLSTSGGSFMPDVRRGQPAPTMTYRDLTLHVGSTAAMAGNSEAATIANADQLPPFDVQQARSLMAGKKHGGGWARAPTEAESKAFLLKLFRNVPDHPHRKIRQALWPGTPPGPKAK